VYFAAPLKGFPVELDIGAGGQKTRVMEIPEPNKVWYGMVWYGTV